MQNQWAWLCFLANFSFQIFPYDSSAYNETLIIKVTIFKWANENSTSGIIMSVLLLLSEILLITMQFIYFPKKRKFIHTAPYLEQQTETDLKVTSHDLLEREHSYDSWSKQMEYTLYIGGKSKDVD